MERKSSISIRNLDVESLLKIIPKNQLKFVAARFLKKIKTLYFGNTLYKQIDVAVLVPPLNPTLFNADLTHKERKSSDTCSLEWK